MAIATKDVFTTQSIKSSVLDAKYSVQWIAVFSSHIITFSHGIAVGWFSPTLLTLQSFDNTPLNFTISMDEASWVGTCWGIGSLIGIISYGYFMEKFGRKILMISIAFPHIASWFLIYYAKNIWYFYVARIFAGGAGGGLYQVMPIYASEISDTCVRGALTTLIMTIASVGTLTGYVMSSYVDYFIIPCVVILLPIIYILALLPLPETPKYLLQTGKIAEAEASYRYYNRIEANTNNIDMNNFNNLRNYYKNESFDPKITWHDLTNRTALKSLFMALVLSLCNQLSGSFSMTQYMSYIFKAANTTMDINLCTIIVSIVQIMATIFGLVFVNILGRRCIMIGSIGAVSIGWTLFGLYLQFTSVDMRKELPWAPLIIMAFVTFTGSAGLIAIMMVVIVESFPNKIRSIGIMITLIFMSCTLTIQLKIYLLELIYFGAANTMFIAAGVCATTLLYAFFNLEETKNKQIDFD